MVRKIVADVNTYEARVALLEDGNLVEIQVETRGKERLVGNIYKGKVANILPGMQAAFVDIGLDKNAFLYAGDILCDEQDFEFDTQEDSDHIKKKLEIPNIKDILKPNQEIMVQILKQSGGNKGARVTTHVTLPGRLLVLMPTVDHVGVSRKISDESVRERLKEITTRIKPEHMGVILRTSAEFATEEEIEAELRFYVRLWHKICDRTEFVTAPRLINAEENLLFRTVRDMFTEDVAEFIINDKDYFEKITALANIISPNMASRLSLYEGKDNIFDYYELEEKINKASSRKVWLKNGCYLVIDETEALTVIDVNTGKYIGEDNLQDTILNANKEAAEEIAKQIRLRDISGIVIVDFIDMDNEPNRKAVLDSLVEATKKDRIKVNVLGMTELGLVEITRKKVRHKLSALTQMTCPTCGGSGKIYNLDNMAMRLRREVIRTLNNKSHKTYLVEVGPALEDYVVNKNNQNQAILPNCGDVVFYIKGVPGYSSDHIKITAVTDMSKLTKAQIFC